MVTETPLRQRPIGMTRGRRLRRATGRMLPTMATLGNLVCGFAAIYYASRGADHIYQHVTNFSAAGWFIVLAMVFDGLDGALARITRSTSDLGAQLDSLADIVSFGVAPAFLMLQVLAVRMGSNWFVDQWMGGEGAERIISRAIWVVAAIFACCAALRLARFNIETTTEESAHMWFKGLPSPGAAAAITTLVLLLESLVRNDLNWAVPIVFWALPPATLAAALLMVSNVPYPHGTNHFLGGRHRFGNLVAALLVLSVLLVFQQHTLVLGSVAYVILGPAIQLYRKLFSRDRRSVDELAAEVVADEDDEDSPEDPDASGDAVE